MNNISPINMNSMDSLLGSESSKTSNKQDGESFAQLLSNAVSDVNNSQVEGYSAMEDIATGKVTNLQEAVQKIEEADLSLKLGLEVKNKALSAFKEIQSIQI